MKEKDGLYQPHEIIWSGDKIARLWGYYSSHTVYQSKYFGRQSGKEVAALLKNKKLFKHAKEILDFSCGKGDLIEACIPHLRDDQKIYACDVSQSSIDEALKKLKCYKNFSGATTVQKFPSELESKKFNLVILTEVIEHLDDQEIDTVLGEIKRILAPGGFLFLTTPYNENLEVEKTICPECGCIFHRWQHMQSWTIDRLKDKLSKYFTMAECRNIQWGPLALKAYFRLTGRKGNGIYYIGKSD